MAKKGKEFDLKAAKDLFFEYLEKGHKEKHIDLPSDTVQIDDLNRKQVRNRLYEVVDGVLKQIYKTGRPSIELPSRASSNIVWDEENDLLLMGKQIMEKQFHTLNSVADVTRLLRVLEAIDELLNEDMHMTKREVFYSDVNLYWQGIINKNELILMN